MIRRSLAICAALVLTSSLSYAQTGSGGGGSGGGGGSSGGGGGGNFGGGGSGGGGGNSGGGGGNSGGGGGGQNSANAGGLQGQTLNLTGSNSGTPGMAASSSLNASNPFAKTVGNPLYAGRVGSTVEAAPGGFGTPTYTTTNSTGGRTGTGATSVGGRTGGTGNSAGTSFTPSTPNTTIRVHYSAGLKFPSRAVAGGELQGQLREILDRSSTLTSAGKVEVVVEDRVVILRGQAADDDERKLIEGMLRMTPGVREIKNEIRIP